MSGPTTPQGGALRVAVLGHLDLTEAGIRAAAADILGDDVVLDLHPDVPPEAEAIIAAAREADVVTLSNLPFTEAMVEGCPRLKLLCLSFTGTDRIALEACTRAGIVVCNAPGYSTQAVAEFAVGLMLAALRRLPEGQSAARQGGTWQGLVGGELAGRTVGIVGTGSIGVRVARLLDGFDCRLLGFGRTPRQDAKELGIAYADLDDLLAQSDVVTLHLPLNQATRGLIDARRLALMKPSAILVNTARGPLVDQAALVEALRSGRLAGAALDTVDPHPPLPADHPLLGMPNVLVTPHMAYASTEAFARRTRTVFGNIAAWRRGEPRDVVAAPDTANKESPR